MTASSGALVCYLWERGFAAGIAFTAVGELEDTTTGLYAPGNFTSHANTEGIVWGLEQYAEGATRGLGRIDVDMLVPPGGP